MQKNAESEVIYEIIELNEYNKLEKIIDLAINRKAPFEKESDKGFKDVCIFFTITDYLRSNGGQVYFVTKDKRLTEAFVNNDQVIVLEEIKDYYQLSNQQFFKDDFEKYLYDQIGDYYQHITVTKAWYLRNEGWELTVRVDQEYLEIKIDLQTKEITNIENI